MKERTKITAKKVGKIVGASIAATGVIAFSALVASGAAVGAVVEGFKAARDAVKKSLVDTDEIKEEDIFVREDIEMVKRESKESINEDIKDSNAEENLEEVIEEK